MPLKFSKPTLSRDGEYEMNWNTDINAAPKGEDVLVSIWALNRESTMLALGMQVFEPYEREQDDNDEDAEGGTWGEHNGDQGIWFWYCSHAEGQTHKDEIAAWAPAPDSYQPSPDDREHNEMPERAG